MPRKDTGFRISPERILNFSLSPLTFISHHPDPVMGSLLSLSLSLPKRDDRGFSRGKNSSREQSLHLEKFTKRLKNAIPTFFERRCFPPSVL